MNQPSLSVYADLESLYRPQRVWAQGRGLVVVAAHLLCGAGAGSWLLGLVFGSRALTLLGLVAVAACGLLHLGFLGHPERAWRMMRRPRSSWLSRGLLAMVIFIPASAMYLIPAYAPSAPWHTSGVFGRAMLVFSLLGMTGIFLNSGFVYAAARPISLWHSPLLPLSSIAAGVRGGAALALICLPFAGFSSGVRAIETWWLVATAASLFLLAVEVARGRGDETVAQSLRVLWTGQNAWLFFLGWLVLGVLLPAGLVLAGYPSSLPTIAFVVAGVASLLGDLARRYCVNTAGIYVPLLRRAPR
jgi:formate-dependent nitrite reductase membrane component NrfD